MASHFQRVRREALELMGVFLATKGIKDFVSDITTSDAALGRMSKNIVVSTETLSAWQGAIQSVGGNASSITSSMMGLTQQFAQFAMTGRSDVIPYLRALGINVADAQGKMRPMDEIMLDLSDKFKAMGSVKANFFGRALGFDQDTINLMMKGRQELEKTLDDQKRLGVTSEADAKRAAELQKQISYTERAFTSFGRVILNEVTPYIIDLLKWFDEWIEKNGDWLKQDIVSMVRDFVRWIKQVDWSGLIKGAESFLKSTDDVVTSLGGWKEVIEVIFGLWVGSKFLGMMGGMRSANALLLEILAAHDLLSGKGPLTDWAKGQDQKHPWLGNLDNWMKRHFGIGATHDEQKKNSNGDPIIKPTGRSTGGYGSDPVSTTVPGGDVQKYFADLERANGLPSGMLDRDWQAESNRGKDMYSSAGAQGHFQFMPGTAKDYGLDAPNDLAKSAAAAAKYFGDLKRKYGGDVGKAIAAYNWGPGNLDKDIARNGDNWKAGLPDETSKYLAKVGGSNGGNNTTTTQVNVGSVVVHTQATDANGIARDMGTAIKQRAFTNQANSGIS